MENWKPPDYFKDNFENISIEFFKKVHEESEKILADKLQSDESITLRAYTIAGLSASVVAFSIGVLLDHSNLSGFFMTTIIIEIVFGICSMILLIRPIRSRIVYPLGASPKELMHKDFIDGRTDEWIMKNLTYNLILTNEDRIQKNENQNRSRNKAVDRALLFLCFSPGISLILAALWNCAVLYFFSHAFN